MSADDSQSRPRRLGRKDDKPTETVTVTVTRGELAELRAIVAEGHWITPDNFFRHRIRSERWQARKARLRKARLLAAGQGGSDP